MLDLLGLPGLFDIPDLPFDIDLQFDIDLSDKHDVGETATFETEYEKSLILMRWIRRSIENKTLFEIL